MPDFQLVSPYQPAGDQPAAIDALVRGLREGKGHQTLLGVTGSGKTFAMANVIAQVGKPALVMSHNKTLAAQLYSEFKEFFPHNAVRYFVSYYDYYQPEAYIPQRDIYIEKDASINEEIELAPPRLHVCPRSAGMMSSSSPAFPASTALGFARRLPQDDGSPPTWPDDRPRRDAPWKFVDIQYDRNDVSFERGKFRVRGDVVELWAAYEEVGYRIELFGDEVETLAVIDLGDGQCSRKEREHGHLPGQAALRPARRTDQGSRSSRSSPSLMSAWARRLREQGKAPRGPAAAAARTAIRYRDAPRGRLLLRNRELQPASDRPRSPERRRTPCSTSSRRTPSCSWMSRTLPFPRCAGCSRAISAGKARWWSTASACRARLIIALFALTSGKRSSASACFRSRPRPSDYEITMSGGDVVEQVIRPTGLIDPIVQDRASRAGSGSGLAPGEAKKRAGGW